MSVVDRPRPFPGSVPASVAAPGPASVPASVAVVGACGGAGASSLAAALAVVAAREGPTALVDLDLHGGGIDVLLGAEAEPGARWPDLHAARGTVDPDDLAASLPRWRHVPVLSAGRWVAASAEVAVPDVLRAAGSRHRLVLDVPRDRVGAVVGGEVPGGEVPGVVDLVVVVPLSVPALAGACALRTAWDGPGRWCVVVRDVRGAELRPADVADALGVPVVARVRDDRRCRAAVERGEGPRVGHGSALRAAAGAVLDALGTGTGTGTGLGTGTGFGTGTGTGLGTAVGRVGA